MANRYNLVDTSWELTDPNPDIHAMFVEFSREFFWDKLGSVSVKWSKRMTLCAGLCRYSGRGGLCEIVLSEPLLKLRPRKDLVETLLHEMIHAYLFVADGNREHDAHGPKFCSHMNRINQLTGTHITVFHSFHDEVNHYKVHWWKCNGPCQHRPPFFGVVKRSMNRKPGPNDFWYNDHQATCGGTFIKIKEPENTKKKADPKPKMPGKGNILGAGASPSSHKIDEYFHPSGSSHSQSSGASHSQSSGSSHSPPTNSSTMKPPSSSQATGSSSSGKISNYFKTTGQPNKSGGGSSLKNGKTVGPSRGPSSTYTPTAASGSSLPKPSPPFKVPPVPQSSKSNGNVPVRKPGSSGTNNTRKPTAGNSKENKGKGAGGVRRGGTATAPGSRTITVVTLDDDDDCSSCPRGNPRANSVPGTAVKKPEEKSTPSSNQSFKPFSGKGYVLGGGGHSTPPPKKPKNY